MDARRRRAGERRRAVPRPAPAQALMFGGAVSLVLLALVVAVLVRGDSERAATPGGATATTSSAGYGLEEVADLTTEDLAEARFVSITVKTPDGLTSTMVSRDGSAFQQLLAAVTGAAPVDERVEDQGSALTFVLPDRRTAAYVLDLDRNLLSREGTAWRPAEDLRLLLRAADPAR